MSSLSPLLYFNPKEWPQHIHALATIAPMVSGVIAPLAVLYDIPALTEKWYIKDGETQPDFKASLVLSSISLVATVIGNTLLVVRFSSTEKRWRVLTRMSVIFWGIKLVVSLVNVIIFGAVKRQGHGYKFSEGFWCAVLSVILGGIVFCLLLLHWVIELRRRDDSKTTLQQTVRVTGRHFMLQATLYVATVALMAVIFSFIEGWSFLGGIYFATVTLLTVGFGDFEPTRVSTKILLFPFALIGIAQLGSILGMIISFFSSRAAERKAQSRALMEHERQIEQDKIQHDPDLFKEIEFLVHLNGRQDMKDRMAELAMSVGGFLVFWVVGAAIFSVTEGWTYATAMYFCYVFFLSIGYGDFAPISAAGRAAFIIYALIAVPIMASFAVTAIQGIVTQISEWRLAKRKIHEGIDNAGAEDSSDVVPHAEYVERYYQTRKWTNPSSSSSNRERRNAEKEEALEQRERDVQAREDEAELTILLIEHALDMERHARRLLETHLPNGSKAQIVLKADRNVQLRHLRLMHDSKSDPERKGGGEEGRSEEKKGMRQALRNKDMTTPEDVDLSANANGDESGTNPNPKRNPHPQERQRAAEGDDPMARAQIQKNLYADDDPDWLSHPLDDSGTMQEIRRYRQSFAAFLATGARLRRLEGVEKYKAERRLMRESDEVDQGELEKDGPVSWAKEESGVPDASKSEKDKAPQPEETNADAKGDRPPDEELGKQHDEFDDTL